MAKQEMGSGNLEDGVPQQENNSDIYELQEESQEEKLNRQTQDAKIALDWQLQMQRAQATDAQNERLETGAQEGLNKQINAAKNELAVKLGISREELDKKTKQAEEAGESPLSASEREAWQKNQKADTRPKSSWLGRLFGRK